MEKNVSKARFIVPSVVGIFLFMIPIKVDGSWTIAVKIIADWISAIAESILPGLCLFILTVSAVLCLMAFAKPKFIMENALLKEAFCCTPFWAATAAAGFRSSGIRGCPADEVYASPVPGSGPCGGRLHHLLDR